MLNISDNSFKEHINLIKQKGTSYRALPLYKVPSIQFIAISILHTFYDYAFFLFLPNKVWTPSITKIMERTINSTAKTV